MHTFILRSQHLSEQLDLGVFPPLRPRYTIGPLQLVPCLCTNLESRQWEWMESNWELTFF